MENGFKFNPYTMDQCTLAQAQEHTARVEPRSAVMQMSRAIPETQHGLFVITVDRVDRNILHAHLTPDRAMEAMQGLYKQIGKDTRDVKHGMNLALNYELGDRIAGLIREGTTKHEPDRKQSYGHLVYRQTYKSLAEEPPANYEGSFLLQTALGMGSLAAEERIKLERVAGRIPLDVRDAFTVDLTRNADGRLEVDGFGISPNVLAAITNQPIPHHSRSLGLLRDEYHALAAKLEPLGASRSKAS